jgi:Arc/MetJ-type ribon-helix-helix transcriptional regulator
MIRRTKNISITMPIAMAKQVERLAKRENRTMSELVREALRRYEGGSARTSHDDLQWAVQLIADSKREQREKPMSSEELIAESARLAGYGSRQARKLGIKESDIVGIIRKARARHRAS